MSTRSRFFGCVLTLTLVVGCGGKTHESGATSRPAATSPPIASVSAQPTAAVAADPLSKKHFWFTYSFDQPGKRYWVRVADKKWEERWESGEVIKYVEGARYEHDEIKGLVVTRDDGSLDVLIPDGGKGAMILFRDPEKAMPDSWSPLGEIEGLE